jgi:hypothetical protein
LWLQHKLDEFLRAFALDDQLAAFVKTTFSFGPVAAKRAMARRGIRSFGPATSQQRLA